MSDVKVGIIMGSQSDWPTMKEAADILDELGVAYEAKIVSAHRTPDRLWDYGKTAVARGLHVIIAGAGGAAHLPGMMASKTRVPVIGVPVQTRALSGVDSLYSIVQMPKGFPVATMAIGAAGAANAGLMAAGILAVETLELAGTGKLVYFMAISEAKFRKPVTPGVLLDLEASFIQQRARVCKVAGRASVNGETTCEVQFTAMIADG